MGFEANVNNNANRKELKCRSLLADLAKDYNEIKFVNHCFICLAIFGNSSESEFLSKPAKCELLYSEICICRF